MIPFLMWSYLGKGEPRHKLEMVQLTSRINILSFDELAILINCYKAPVFNIISLYATQSPDKLPIAQTAWSIIPGLF
jgi:hypothetical protein